MQQPPRHMQQSRYTAPRKRRWGPLEPLGRIIDRLGPWGPVIGVGGLFIGTLTLSLFCALMLRTARLADVINPFRDADNHPTAVPNATPNPDFLAPTIDIGNARVWQGTERVTVLLLGSDARPNEAGLRTRTDTIMLLMVDPSTKHASILSIPRDLYVDVPGYGLNRVNTPYVFGGAQLAVDTIQYNLGIRINYYAIIDFNVFITLVDEIGGIDIDVPKDIYDPTYPDQSYGYDPFYITAGRHHMDGTTALKYARTRHTDNDYERARRQQAVLFAIRERIVKAEMLPMLIQKAPSLYAPLSSGIRTNMTLDEMISLALLAQDIPTENIRNGVIDSNYVVGYITSQGASVLVPNRDRIGPFLEYVFWSE